MKVIHYMASYNEVWSTMSIDKLGIVLNIDVTVALSIDLESNHIQGERLNSMISENRTYRLSHVHYLLILSA